MNKLSIQTLVQNSTTVADEKGSLDVYSLANVKKSYDDIHSYTAESLIKIRKVNREKKLDVFLKYYRRCFENIIILNNEYKTDLIFNVPDDDSDCLGYTADECIEFITKKLKEKYMDICRLKNNTIFVTWKYIEFNKDKAKVH